MYGADRLLGAREHPDRYRDFITSALLIWAGKYRVMSHSEIL